MDERKTLILYSATGGGHRSVAEALKEAFARRCPTVQVDTVDLLHDYTCYPLRHADHHYQSLVRHALFLWRAILWMGESPWRLSAIMRLCQPLARPARRLLRHTDADLVISVHPLLNHLPLRFLREGGSEAPFVTVVTDWITVPPAWFCAQVDLCMVASEAAAQRALAAGMPSERVRIAGIPVGDRFQPVSPSAKPRWRRRLGLDPNEPAVLLVGGGGIGSLEDMAQALSAALAHGGRGQLIVVCGRDQRLQQQLAQQQWPLPVTVKGFVSDMPDWMAAAELIVTKAGPSTIAEALVVGLPILLYGFIPGQEAGNISLVVENGVGAYAREPGEIARTVAEWLSPGNDALQIMAARSQALGCSSAADVMVDEALRLLPVG